MNAKGRRLGYLWAGLVLTSACGLQQPGIDGARVHPSDSSEFSGASAGLGRTGPGQSATHGYGGGLPNDPGSSGSTLLGDQNGLSGDPSNLSTRSNPSGGTSASPDAAMSTGQAHGLKGELVVAYINVTGFDQLANVVVVNTATTGDANAQTAALAKYVNSHGGIAGRQLVPKVHDYNAQQANEAGDNNLCQQIITTDHAFLAELEGQIHYSARACYAARRTLAFEGSGFGWGKPFYADHAPYLWSPSKADYDQTSRALVATIKARSWLAGESKVGIVLWDDKPYHQVADRTLAPALKALGVRVVEASVSNADIGSIENGIHAAAQTMLINGVDHLLFLGSAPLQPFFVQQNQQQHFVYALSSFDVPRYLAVNFPDNMVGALGVGFSPVNDVLDAQYPYPQAGLERTCKEIYRQGGVDIPTRYSDTAMNSQQAMSYCESTLLLKQVADTIPDRLTPANWAASATRLGGRFQAAQTFSTSFGPGKPTGPDQYREITFDGACSCMAYSSGRKALP